MKEKAIEYICTWCGMRTVRGINAGRPMPGKCPRHGKMPNGQLRPHIWRKNKKIY